MQWNLLELSTAIESRSVSVVFNESRLTQPFELDTWNSHRVPELSLLALNLNHRPQCVSQLPEMKQLILCKGDYLDFLSAPQPILAVSACGGGSGSDNSIRMPSGSCPGCNARTSGGEGADKRPSHATKQPTCRTFNQFDLAPSLAILSPDICLSSFIHES